VYTADSWLAPMHTRLPHSHSPRSWIMVEGTVRQSRRSLVRMVRRPLHWQTRDQLNNRALTTQQLPTQIAIQKWKWRPRMEARRMLGQTSASQPAPHASSLRTPTSAPVRLFSSPRSMTCICRIVSAIILTLWRPVHVNAFTQDAGHAPRISSSLPSPDAHKLLHQGRFSSSPCHTTCIRRAVVRRTYFTTAVRGSRQKTTPRTTSHQLWRSDTPHN